MYSVTIFYHRTLTHATSWFRNRDDAIDYANLIVNATRDALVFDTRGSHIYRAGV